MRDMNVFLFYCENIGHMLWLYLPNNPFTNAILVEYVTALGDLCGYVGFEMFPTDRTENITFFGHY